MGNGPIDWATANQSLGTEQLNMRTTRLRTLSLAMLVLGGTAFVLLVQHQSRKQERSEIQTLLRQIDALTDTNESLSNRLARSSQTRTPDWQARQVVGPPAAVFP